MLDPRKAENRHRRDPTAHFVASTEQACDRAAGRTIAPARECLRLPACCPSSRLSRSGASSALSVCIAPTSVALSGSKTGPPAVGMISISRLAVAIAAEAARQQWLEPRRDGQLGRRESVEQSVERRPLRCSRHHLRDRGLAVHDVRESSRRRATSRQPRPGSGRSARSARTRACRSASDSPAGRASGAEAVDRGPPHRHHPPELARSGRGRRPTASRAAGRR